MGVAVPAGVTIFDDHVEITLGTTVEVRPLDDILLCERDDPIRDVLAPLLVAGLKTWRDLKDDIDRHTLTPMVSFDAMASIASAVAALPEMEQEK